MRRINISFSLNNNKDIIITNTSNDIEIETFFITPNITSYTISTNIDKIKSIIDGYNITSFNMEFERGIDENIVNQILTKMNDILYCYYPKLPTITLDGVSSHSRELMDELIKYKDIVMDPNKNPETYLKYVLSRVPRNYKANIFRISKDKQYTPTKMFPLTKGVGAGSSFDAYFVHIQPKIINRPKNIYLVGKAVTFDTGGLNLKVGKSHIEDMKVDMIGSAIIVSVLNLLSKQSHDTKHNIHLIIPIVENMINGNAIRPGMVISSMSGKLVEIVNTDAEGRLCLADGLDYINIYLMKKFKSNNNLIIDIATLTGNTEYITSGISGIIMGNDTSKLLCSKLIEVGESTGEYLDYLKLRPEYMDFLKTPVGDIANLTRTEAKCGCIIGGTFLNQFTNPNTPWIHLDVASTTFIDGLPTSYGIYLLYCFIKQL